jgi:hypothetical protein
MPRCSSGQCCRDFRRSARQLFAGARRAAKPCGLRGLDPPDREAVIVDPLREGKSRGPREKSQALAAAKSGRHEKSGTVRLAMGQDFGLGCRPDFGEPEEMSNRAIWNVRLRHVWLATPLKGKRLKRRQRLRIGLEEALLRKAKAARQDAAATESES